MTSSDLWAIFAAKNPKMGGADDSTITMTVRGLRKLFDQAYDQGHEQGVANGRAVAAREAEINATNKPSSSADIFKDVFGKGNPFKS